MEPAIARETSEKQQNRGVWFTFDDGPNPNYTMNLLNCLDIYNVKATFFVCGEFLQQYPRITKLAFDRGHEIGNHTWDHPDLKLLSLSKIIDQLKFTSDLIQSITGVKPVHFRAPYSSYDERVIQMANILGLKMLGWTRAGMDWEQKLPECIAQNVLKDRIQEDDIIVLHDGSADVLNHRNKNINQVFYTNRYNTIHATSLIIEKLQERNMVIYNPKI